MKPFSLPTEFVAVENWKPAPDPCTERERLTRQASRNDRYAQVRTLRALGLGNEEIARRVGLTARTLQRWRKSGFPEAGRRRKRSSRFDSYASYVLSRWEQGCTNGLQIYREICAQGYTGTQRQVYRFLVPLRRNQRIIQKAVVPHAPEAATFLPGMPSGCLCEREPLSMRKNKPASPLFVRQVKQPGQPMSWFRNAREMLHTRSGEKLESWLQAVKASHIRELESFVRGVERDKAAVVVGLTLPHNNGLAEGKINKLKLIKRMGYGRAGFALLRQRVLHAL